MFVGFICPVFFLKNVYMSDMDKARSWEWTPIKHVLQ